MVSGRGQHSVFDLTEIDQIWAEAIVAYRNGEDLFLKGDVAGAAYEAQQEAMEGDDREGIVAEYLERLLPENWNALDLFQRRSFLNGGEFGGAPEQGTVRREKVCVMEIWCECFGKDRPNLRKTDSFEIEAIINKIGGWTRYTGNRDAKVRIPQYGPQKTFVRNVDGYSERS